MPAIGLPRNKGIDNLQSPFFFIVVILAQAGVQSYRSSLLV
jgi:hypothetical protein